MKTFSQFIQESINIIEHAPRKVTKTLYKGPIKKIGTKYEEMNGMEEGYRERRKGEKKTSSNPESNVKKEDFSLKPKSKEDLAKRDLSHHPPVPQDEYFRRSAKRWSTKEMDRALRQKKWNMDPRTGNLENRKRASGISGGDLSAAVKTSRWAKEKKKSFGIHYGKVDYIPQGHKDAYKETLRKKGIKV
jgi:hypothetical protein